MSGKAAFVKALTNALVERAAGAAAPAEKKALRLYHGTIGTDSNRVERYVDDFGRTTGSARQGFDHLSPDMNWDQLGLHVGTQRQANSFAGWRPEHTDEDVLVDPNYFSSRVLDSARVVPLDVDLNNPLRLEDRTGHWQPHEIYRQLVNMDKLPMDKDTFLELSNAAKSRNSADRADAMKRVRQMIEGLGHDGVVYKNRVEGIPSGITYNRLKGLDEEELSDEEFSKLVPEAEDSYIIWNKDKYRSPFGDGTGAGFSNGGPVGPLSLARCR